MKIVLFFLLSFSLYSKNFKIASYNVENLFDMQLNGTEYESYIPNRHNWTHKNFQKKLLNIAEVICDIDADIIALQEIENEHVLKRLKKRLRSIGCYYKYHAITHKKHSAIQLAMLSKVPIVSSREIEVNKKLKYRPILETKFMVENRAFYIFNNHWSSKHSKESSRIRSAKVLKKRVLQLPKKTPYLLLGDFNSDYDEYRHFEKRFNNTGGVVGINHLLKTIQKRKLVREKDMREYGFKHYNLWLELENYKRWSHNFYGDREALDSILLPPSLFDGEGIDYVNSSFKLFRPKYLFTKKGYVNRWQYKYGDHLGVGYSDHLPIVATFSTLPYKYDSNRDKVLNGTVKDLYVKFLKNPIYIKRVKVVSKNRLLATLVQKDRVIYLYGAKELKVGRVYDLIVYRVKNYKGLQEIIDFTIEKEYYTKNLRT